jgi:probable rRNA maturation factor
MEVVFYQSIQHPGVSRLWVKRVIQSTLTRIKRIDTSLSVHLVGEHRIRTLNRTYRGIDTPTDVLSFGTESRVPIKGSVCDMGDLFLCPGYIKRQARRFGVSFRQEMARMLVHGILHLHGYDHVKKKEATEMFSLQESILTDMQV